VVKFFEQIIVHYVSQAAAVRKIFFLADPFIAEGFLKCFHFSLSIYFDLIVL